MTLTDYLVDSLLVALVLRQLRESRLDLASLLLPFGVIVWVANNYLKTVPTGGSDLVLIVGLSLLGVLAGLVSGLATRVRSDGGKYALVRAGWVAAGTWVLSMGGRFAFAVWAAHGGGPQLARFSGAHHLAPAAWTAALVLMAFAEVVVRVGVLFVRSRRVLAAGPQPELIAA